MKITPADWLVVATYFLVNLLIGLYYRKKASASTDAVSYTHLTLPTKA